MPRLLAAACAVILSTGCLSPPDAPEVRGGESPWSNEPLFGSFEVNGTAVVTNQDGSSADYKVDYVNASALPGATFETFALRVYVPASEQHSTRLAQVQVSAGFVDGARTGNIYTWAEFIERTTLNGELYSAYEITASHQGTPALDPSSFANVVFEMSLKHLDAADERDVVSQRPLTIEIYKR